jgi:nucleotide-binding universal stress UspA family protein
MSMSIRRIVVGLDASPLAETILAAVRPLALRCDADVVLLHVVAVPETLSAAAAKAGATLLDVVDQERRRAHEYLEGVAQSLRDAGVRVQTATAVGEAAAEIVGYAEREHVDVIALATHGRSGLGRWLYGSVADAVLHGAKTPLLLIRPGAEAAAASPEVRRIVVALDGSPLAETALPTASYLAATLHVPLTLLRVVESTTLAFAGDPFTGVYLDYQRLFDILREDAERYLAERATELRRTGVTVATVVSAGAAADAISAEVGAHPGTLLVLSTHGRSGWRAFALGSVARRVVLLVGAPVLVVPPPESPAPGA